MNYVVILVSREQEADTGASERNYSIMESQSLELVETTLFKN
jgi:hypothetical protein